MNWTRPPYRISDDPGEVDFDVVHGFLTTSYWARGIRREIVERAVENSMPFSLKDATRQIGFARVITDRTTFGYLADVFVVDEHRGRGLGAWLVDTVLGHPDLQGLRRWLLATRDAHGLYAIHGFTALADPSIYMTIHDPDIYSR